MVRIMQVAFPTVALSCFIALALPGCGGQGGGGGSSPSTDASPPVATGTAGIGNPQGPAPAAARNPADNSAAVVRGAPAWTGTDEEARRLIIDTLAVHDNLKDIGIGFHYHHDTFVTLLPELNNPRAYDEQKRPRFSWRVALLPYLGHADLYNQYNFDEPWDGEQNKRVLNQMPDAFRTPGDEGTSTRFQIVVGPGAAFEPGQRETRIRDFRDGTSNSLLVVHAGPDKAVPWTKPDDLQFDAANVRAMFGDVGETLQFATVDGAVHKVRADAPEDLLRNLITPADGNPIDLSSVAVPATPLPWLAEPPRSGPLAAAYMPDDCFGVVAIRPQRLMGSTLFQKSGVPEAMARTAEDGKVDPRTLEEVVLWLAPPDPADNEIGNLGGAGVRCSEPLSPKAIDEILAQLPVKFSPDDIHRPDGRTILCGSKFRLCKLLTGRNPPAELSSRAVQTQGDVVALVDSSDGQLIQRVAGLLPPDNPDAQGMLFGAALFLAPFANSNLIELNLDLSGENLLALRTECKTPQDAVKFQQMIAGMILQARQQPRVPAEAGRVIDQLKITANDTTGMVALPASEELTTMITDAVRQALARAMTDGRRSAQRLLGLNELRLIGLAYHMMYDAHQGVRPWAAATDRDADGKPYLSWRVHFLPFLEEKALYEQFHLNERWDSDHNRAMLDQMPDRYRFSQEGDPTLTQVVFLTGPQTVFDGKINGDFRKITDGTSNTLLALIVPAEKAVPWTKPVDAVFDPDDPLAVARPISPDGIHVLFVDGSTRTLPADIDAESFKALVTPTGGEPVSLE